jgi:hypothetical protein
MAAKSTSDINPETIKLIGRMADTPSSRSFWAGEPVDLTWVDPLSLGDLWATAHGVETWRDGNWLQSPAAVAARAVLDLGRKMDPVFRATACRDYLDLLTRKAEGDEALDRTNDYPWRRACFALRRCIELSSAELKPAAERFLSAWDWKSMPHLAVALARLVDPECGARVLDQLAADLADSPLLVGELRMAAYLDLAANILLADVVSPDHETSEEAKTEGLQRLSDCPAYAGFAEAGLKRAAERLRKIHAFELPYASDKAFTLNESAVIARLARVALGRDEAWLPPVLDELFSKVTLAPTAAKTAPSQSVAIALGHAVEALPTPEAVATLREVIRTTRHAGVVKRLQRNLRGAERGLAGRPEIALRLPPDRPISKPELTTIARCLEAGFALGMDHDYEDWRVRLAEHPQIRALAAALVWRILDPAGSRNAVLPMRAGARLALRDLSGAEITPKEGSRVALWHPSDATAQERDAWRDRFAALKIKQPFKQVFREHYAPPPEERSDATTAMFAGHVVAVTPFLGLARRERWQIDDYCLIRSFGKWTAKLDLADPVYPGYRGETTTGSVSIRASGEDRSARLGAAPAAALSEILRSVDLLVSASGFAVTAEEADGSPDARLRRLAETPLGTMAEMRKQALQRMLGGLDGVRFEARHLCLGPYAIHLSTGRVTRDGDPVTIDLPKDPKRSARPWLPYDEKLLEAIYWTTIEIQLRLSALQG